MGSPELGFLGVYQGPWFREATICCRDLSRGCIGVMRGLGDTTPTMENQMQKTLKTDMETGVVW